MFGIMLEPITKDEAKAKGLRFYFTGRVCRRGHVAQRYVSTGNCQECAIPYSKAHREANPERCAEYHLRARLAKKYGLTIEEYTAMLTAQNNLCDACHDPFPSAPCVDHCHNTGKVRALLCRGCNTALGHAKDDPVILRKLADYLERHR
jgi:hypothetical protein